MFSHVMVGAEDVAASKKFYDAVLGVIGISEGKADPKAQRTGSIEFLSPDKSKTLFRINLSEVGLLNTNVVASTANQDQIKRAKFELYVGKMEIDTGGGAFDS